MSSDKSEIIIEHYNYLDGLRGVAALLVLSVHLLQIINLFNGKSFSFGAYGVQLFYILSALTLFLSSSQRFTSESKASLKFFIRRFFRIAPLFYIAVVLSWILMGGIDYRLPTQGITISNIISHFLFLFGFNKYWINSVVGVEWSVFCEVFFYLSLPLLFNYIKNKKTAIKLALFSVFISFIFKYFIQYFYPGDSLLYEWSSLFILSNYCYFTFGIILYFLFKDNKHYNFNVLTIGWIFFIILIGLILIIQPTHFGALLSSIPLALLVFLMRYKFPLTYIFNNKLTRFVGKISYSIYLVHFMVLGLFAKLVINSNLLFFNQNIFTRLLGIFGAVFFVIIISMISYRLIERPGINFGRNLIKKISTRKQII